MPTSTTSSSLSLISPAYLAEQKKLHESGYGGRGFKWTDVVLHLMAHFHARDVLDYGCGQGTLGQHLRTAGLRESQVTEYDPAIRRFQEIPLYGSDLVVCTDVLEHIELEYIDNVLRHLRDLTQIRLFTVISLVGTEKRLSDGRDAHILIRDVPWWLAKFESHGFAFDYIVDNPKPEKQFAAVWKKTP